jgi:hypothetical protein
MAFPATAALDDFNRANAGPPPSASWSNRPLIASATGSTGLKVSSNAVIPDRTDLYYEGWWNPSQYRTSSGLVEVWAVVGTIDRELFRLWMHLNSPGVDGATDGYFVQYDFSSGTDALGVFRVTNDTITQLGANISLEIGSGDGVGLAHDGSTLTVYHYDADGGGDIRNWASVGTRSDSTYTSGFLGAGISYEGSASTLSLTTFGGGEASAGSTVALEQAVETDTAFSFTPSGQSTVVFEQAPERDVAFDFTPAASASALLERASETDVAFDFSPVPGAVSVLLERAVEVDAAFAFVSGGAVVFVDASGFPRAADGSVVMTSSTTGADQDETGFLRAPSGELVYTTSLVGAVRGEGFLRSPSHALVIAVGASGVRETGFLRDSNWALCVTTTGPWTVQEGFMRDSSSRLAVTLV